MLMKITGTILTFTYNFSPIYCSCTKMTITLQNIVMAKESLAFAVLHKFTNYPSYSPFCHRWSFSSPSYDLDFIGPVQAINLEAICVLSTTFCRLFILQDQQSSQKDEKLSISVCRSIVIRWKVHHFLS